MLNQKQIDEIHSLLEQSQNPIFFFDNDVDGLCSFLLLRRYIGRGKGVAIKSFPNLGISYVRKLHELKPDMIFILDKPIVDQEFIDAATQLGMPIIWIDHHTPQQDVSKVNYYNPIFGKTKSYEPTSYLCYLVTKKKEDEWIAMLGCLSDYFLPDFAEEFSEKYKDIFSIKPLKKMIYETEFGKITKILSFALKDKISNVIKMLKLLLKIKSPYEILLREEKFEPIYRRYKQIKQKYDKLLEKAEEIVNKEEEKKKFLYFQYGGDLSLSAELSNEFLYLYPNKEIVVVAYIKNDKVNFALRSQENSEVDIRILTAKVLEGIEGTGGGHKHACGSSVKTKDLSKYKENLEEQINQLKL